VPEVLKGLSALLGVKGRLRPIDKGQPDRTNVVPLTILISKSHGGARRPCSARAQRRVSPCGAHSGPKMKRASELADTLKEKITGSKPAPPAVPAAAAAASAGSAGSAGVSEDASAATSAAESQLRHRGGKQQAGTADKDKGKDKAAAEAGAPAGKDKGKGKDRAKAKQSSKPSDDDDIFAEFASDSVGNVLPAALVSGFFEQESVGSCGARVFVSTASDGHALALRQGGEQARAEHAALPRSLLPLHALAPMCGTSLPQQPAAQLPSLPPPPRTAH
jgi:hypothetical protein